jgi:hypothetical protein
LLLISFDCFWYIARAFSPKIMEALRSCVFDCTQTNIAINGIDCHFYRK